MRTHFEQTNGAQYPRDVNEYAYTAALDEANNCNVHGNDITRRPDPDQANRPTGLRVLDSAARRR